MTQVRPLFEFRTIELPREADVCVRFWRDAYVCSFDDPDRYRTRTDDEYLIWLADLIAEIPQGCVHLLRNGEIAGQVVVNPRAGNPVGYVNLFYVVPAMRGTGAGDALHEYVVAVSASMGIGKLQLSVSPSNERAFRYYCKHGWVDLGPDPKHEEVHRMELSLAERTKKSTAGEGSV